MTSYSGTVEGNEITTDYNELSSERPWDCFKAMSGREFTTWMGFHECSSKTKGFFLRDSRSRNVSKRRLGKRMDVHQLKDLDNVTFVDHISKTG